MYVINTTESFILCNMNFTSFFFKKRSEVLVSATTGMNLENVQSERSQMQKVTCCLTPFLCNNWNRQARRDREQVARIWKEGGMGVSANGCGISFRGDENALESVRCSHNYVNILQSLNRTL